MKNSYSEYGASFCPPNQAAMAAIRRVGDKPHLTADQTAVSISCCPLPVGALLDQSFNAVAECPRYSVITGVYSEWIQLSSGPRHRFSLRCTEIDRSRFTLTPRKEGLRASLVEDSLLIWKADLGLGRPQLQRVNQARIPLALRYGLARIGATHWSDYYFVGNPPGALLTAVLGNAEEDFLYQELIPSSPLSVSDPEQAAIIPRCRGLRHPLSANPECVP